MKLLKLSSMILALVVSLHATEIKPFGSFKFGDSFTPVYESICNTKNITDIKIGFSKLFSKNEFCKNKQNVIVGIQKSIRSSSLYRVKIKGFKHIAGKYLYISAKGINIKGVDFELELTMGTVHDKNMVGSYLLTKNDTIKIGKYDMPLQLTEIKLKAIDNTIFQIHQKEIFDILWKKYGYLVKDNKMKENFKKRSFLDIDGANGTNITFAKYDNSISYKSNGISKKQIETFNEYMKNMPKNSKNDSSGDL